MYDYMLEEIEEKYFNTSKGYYLDKSLVWSTMDFGFWRVDRGKYLASQYYFWWRSSIRFWKIIYISLKNKKIL